MIRPVSSSVDSAVVLGALKTGVRHFKSLIIIMISSRFWNYFSMYCFSLSLNFLYWSLDFLCPLVVPKTAPKFSTYPLNFLINYVYDGRLNRTPRAPRPWWQTLHVQPPCPRSRPLLIAIYLILVSESWVVVASVPSPQFITVEGEAVSVYGVIVIYPFLSE